MASPEVSKDNWEMKPHFPKTQEIGVFYCLGITIETTKGPVSLYLTKFTDYSFQADRAKLFTTVENAINFCREMRPLIYNGMVGVVSIFKVVTKNDIWPVMPAPDY